MFANIESPDIGDYEKDLGYYKFKGKGYIQGKVVNVNLFMKFVCGLFLEEYWNWCGHQRPNVLQVYMNGW